jgi:hypothetical protein
MPSLAGLTPAFPRLVFEIGLAGGGPQDRKGRLHVVNFLRTADLAVAEYENARLALEASVASEGEPRLLHAFSAIDHLESCIISAKRSIDGLRRISRYALAPHIPRDLRKKTEAYSNDVAQVRSAVVHMDNLISSGELEDGQPVALVVAHDGASATIASHQIQFDTLASLLTDLNRLAHELAQYREGDSGESSAT